MKISHVTVAGHIGEAGSKNALAVGVVLDELHGLPSEEHGAEQASAGSRKE